MSGVSTTKKVSKAPKAQWDPTTVKVLCDSCVEEIIVGNRTTQEGSVTLTVTGWGNLITKFNVRAGTEYTQKQIRNKWDSLRGDWNAWDSLMKNEKGLGFNNETGTIEASNEWWKAKIEMNPKISQFRRGPLPNAREMEIMFATDVATGASAFTTAGGKNLSSAGKNVASAHPMDLDEGSGDSSDLEVGRTQNQQVRSSEKRKAPINHSTQDDTRKMQRGKEKPKVGSVKFMGSQIEKMVDAVSTYTSKFTEPSLKSYDPVSDDISECLNMLQDLPGVEVGDEMYMMGTRLFIAKAPRAMFRALPTNDVRLIWLKKEYARENK